MATSTLIYLVLVIAALATDHFVFWRRFTSRSASEPERARLALWRDWMVMLWVLALTAIVLWVRGGQPWSLLRIQVPMDWRLWASAALVVAIVALYAQTISKLCRATGERKAALRARLDSHAAMLPHTRSELIWFTALAITAGICEELVFRGYLLWAMSAVVGLWPAAILSCLVFALAHAYQGMGGILRTGLIGAFFMAAVLALNSLLPVIVAHALIDIGQGIVAWLILRKSSSENEQMPSVVNPMGKQVLEHEA